MAQQTIRQAVFDDQLVIDITQALFALPGRMTKARENEEQAKFAVKYDTSVQDAEAKLADLEAEVLQEVQYDLDENGKKKFTNAESRAIEVKNRLRTTYADRWIDLCNEVAEAKKNRGKLEMDAGRAHIRAEEVRSEYFGTGWIAQMIAGLAHESTTAERTYRHVAKVELGE